MQSNQILVFDIGGEYGHFRKFNTTTSPLTYSSPPRTTLIGIIGAIMGIERESEVGKYREGQTPLADLLSPENAQIAVQVLNPISKVQMAFNLLNTKNSFFNIENRTQIEFEFLKNPRFRIFVKWDNDKLFNELATKIATRQNHFTVCLGLSQLVAITEFVGIFETAKNLSKDFVPVVSAIKMSQLDMSNPIQMDDIQDFKFNSDTQPVFMNSDRLVQEFAEVLIEANGNSILVKSNHIHAVEKMGNIIFL